jgi:hypothetical protein
MGYTKKKPTHIIVSEVHVTPNYPNNEPISMDNKDWWEHRRKMLAIECDGVFEILKNNYLKEIIPHPDESICLELKIQGTKDYIKETKALFKASYVNGFPPDKIPRDVELLPAYEKFLDWLEKRNGTIRV